MYQNSVNIASVLEDIAARQPDNVAIYYPTSQNSYISYTYADLLAESNRIAHGLSLLGITRGTRTALMVKPSLEFFALTFALVRAGIVPVIIDPGMGMKNLKVCLAEAEPEAFIGIPTAHIARIMLGWARHTVKHLVTVGPRLFWGGLRLKQVKQMGDTLGDFATVETQADEVAAIIFTSGSTGVPKGVVYTHGNFMGQVEMIRDTYDIQPGEIDLPTFPVFALFDPVLGMTTVIPKMDFTRPANVHPPDIISAIQKFNVTNMFGSPALLNTVSRYGEEHQTQLPTLKRVISAGAPASGKVLKRYAAMLAPEATINTPYGATEALPVASITHQMILGETQALTDQGAGVCVGFPIEGTTVKVIQISDEPIEQWDNALVLPAKSIGEIVVQGRTVTRTYFNRDHATQLAKIQDGDAFWHRMGDLGYFDEQGRLWFCGRKAHRVVISDSATLFTVPCEAVFNTLPEVYRSALVGVQHADQTIPVLCVELEDAAKNISLEHLKENLREQAQRYDHTSGIEHFLVHPSFPVDIRHNSKIFREKLGPWAAQELGW